MAITNFISTVWSEALIRQLDHKYVAVANCNRDYDGDIVGKGSTVKVCSVGAVTVSDYTKNTNMSAPQTLSDSAATILISQAKSFNFQIDDIDRAQSSPRLMEMAMANAASALANVADKYVFSLASEATNANTITEESLTTSNIVDTIVAAREKLLANGVPGSEPTVLEVTPSVAALIMKAKILQSTDNSESLANGCIGNFIGFEVYVSPNIVTDVTSGTMKCFARTKRAIAFAEQINSVEAYRPESRFADAVKGLHLYGAKVIYPDEFVLVSVKI